MAEFSFLSSNLYSIRPSGAFMKIKENEDKRKLRQCQVSTVLRENSCLVILFIEQTLTLLMKICAKNHRKIRLIMEGGYLETLGSSHVVIDTSYYKE